MFPFQINTTGITAAFSFFHTENLGPQGTKHDRIRTSHNSSLFYHILKHKQQS